MWGTIKPKLQGSKPSNHEIITSLQTFPCCPQNLLGEFQRSTNTPREHQQFLTHLHSSRIISILTKSPKFQCFPNIWDFYIFLGFFFLEPSAAGRSRGDERRGGRAAKFPPVGAGLSSSILKSSNPRSRSSSGLGSDPSGQFQRESFPGSSRGRIPAPNPAPGWIKHKLKQGKTWRKSGFAAGFGSGARRALELIFPLIFPGFSRWFFGNG